MTPEEIYEMHALLERSEDYVYCGSNNEHVHIDPREYHFRHGDMVHKPVVAATTSIELAMIHAIMHIPGWTWKKNHAGKAGTFIIHIPRRSVYVSNDGWLYVLAREGFEEYLDPTLLAMRKKVPLYRLWISAPDAIKFLTGRGHAFTQND